MKLHHSLRIVKRRSNSQAGISLIETMIALGLLLVAAAGILTLATVAMSTTETQGHLAARTAEYGQDKMEQLLALPYDDKTTDTTQFPAVAGPGTGLLVGGGLNPNGPVVGYSDYVDSSGNPVAAAANWSYVRVWQITQVAPNMRQITVLTQVRHSIGYASQTGILPTSTVVSLKSRPF